MPSKDTIRLLNECDSGIKMAVSSIDEVLPSVKNEKLKTTLNVCKQEHENLGKETKSILDIYGNEGKEPNPVAQSMAWVKSNFMMAMEPNDKTVADLMTDGCNMGIKSLNKYLNEYKSADVQVRDITGKLIRSEEKMAEDLKEFL